MSLGLTSISKHTNRNTQTQLPAFPSVTASVWMLVCTQTRDDTFRLTKYDHQSPGVFLSTCPCAPPAPTQRCSNNCFLFLSHSSFSQHFSSFLLSLSHCLFQQSQFICLNIFLIFSPLLDVSLHFFTSFLCLTFYWFPSLTANLSNSLPHSLWCFKDPSDGGLE